MADLEDVTLDGRPLQSLRVADLKAALEERGLSKSGQKNALIKRLKGALMLENLQRTSTAHVGLQPNSQIGEEMSQNSFIKQYLAKQQELLRQRLEREAREAYETNDQEDHSEVNNSTSCPPQAQDVTPALAEQHKPPGPSGGEGLFGAGNEGEADRNQEANVSGPPASGSVTMRVPGSEQRPERGSASNEVAADSDDEDSDDAEEDGDDDDWDSSARRRNLREPARAPTTRERSGASCQPQQQHMPSLLSPQLRQPTPPPSPPPELSFPLPDTPKQSPPSPDVAPARRSPSSSSSGSSSSGSRSSSPEPQRSGHAERKPGPLTLLARKMASEGAFSGAGWHGGDGEGDRQDSSSPSATSFPGRGPPEGLVSAITHTANTAGHVPFPMIPGTNQGVAGAHSAHIQVPVSVLKATATEERDRKRDNEIEREKALELERQEKQRKLEEERERALALEREERERALEKERIERQQAIEREKALQQERELALERERQERERALAKEREEREQALARERALELERQKELERQRALEQERLQKEKEEREKREREELERVMEQERKERERALEQERLERERALEAERREKERIERERALEQERLERERLERERLERERIEREKAMEQERLERERALEQERLERERALEQERLEKERAQERERLERERALEQERLERERALEQERLERERALEQERIEREKAIEREKIEREKALEKEKLERERALEQERLEHERREKERLEREKALEQARIEREALEREREEKARAEREAALEKERIEKERKERLEREKEQEKLERELALEKERKEKERALEQERERALEHERLEKEKAMQKEKEEQEMAQEKERARMAEKERESHLPPSKRGREIGLTPLPTPPLLSTGPGRKSSTDAGEQEDVHAPMSRIEATETGAPMSPTPQSSFKKFRFLRDSQIQPQSSSTSMVIKRPRNFSDTPQPQVSPISSPTNVGERQLERHQPSTEEVPQKQTKQEVVAGLPGTVGTQSEKETTVGTAVVQSPKKDRATNLVSPDKEKADPVKTEQVSKESNKKAKEVDESQGPSSPADAAQRRGRDAKRDEKQARRRSTSNDSSSSESDSGSSSSRSSGSSTSSQEKTSPTSRGRREEKPERDASPLHRVTLEARDKSSKETPKASPHKREMLLEKNDTNAHPKKQLIEAPTREETQRKRKDSEGEEEKDKQRQVKETAMAEPEKVPETSEETPKAFSARKISLSSSKLSPGTGSAEGEQESGAAAGRKRRWGSSTAVTAKKPSISITTDSLKSLIPDIRPLGQEAVVDLHPEEAVLSGAEDEDRERSDQDLQIRRTVTQVVHSESQENGQKEAKRSRQEELEEDDLRADGERTREHEEKLDTSFSGAMETQSPSDPSHDVEMNTVSPGDTLIRRSISQQKTGVSITIDDPVRTARQPSPPRGKVSNIVHISNLVRPFTLGQLKELLSRTGTLVEEGFWIDKIKSHCYVTYCSSDEAVATRAALHGVKWPQSNPKVLRVDFCQQDELDFHKGLGAADRPGAEEQGPGSGRGRASGLPSLLQERDQWAEREREMERREKARAEREWDRDKVKEFGKPGEEKEGGPRRSRSRERRRKERGKSKEKKTEKKDKAAEDPPAKLLDDLFRKTKAAPCIYWLPLTEEQFVQREAARAERTKEREKRRKEQEEEEEKKREEERKERMKAGSGTAGERSEGEKDKDKDRERERDRDRGRDRDRERERDNDKRRDGYRRPGGSGAGGSRRSRSRSDPRERRR